MSSVFKTWTCLSAILRLIAHKNYLLCLGEEFISFIPVFQQLRAFNVIQANIVINEAIGVEVINLHGDIQDVSNAKESKMSVNTK